MLLTLALSGALAADCAQTWSARDLASSTAYASGAFAAMDAQAFERALADVDRRLPCVDEVLTPTDVADIHGVHALQAFLLQDEELTKRSLAAAISALPSYDLSSSIAPSGHDLRQQLDLARGEEPAPGVEVPPPDQAVLYVDGGRSLQRPSGRPVVVQLLRVDGSLAFSGWYRADEELPPYAVGDREDALILMGELSNDRSSGWVLVGVGGAAILSSGLLYALAASSRARFDDLDTPYEDLESLRAQSNGFVVASGVSGALGVGLGVAAALTW